MGYGCMGDFYWELEALPNWNVLLKELPAAFESFKQKGMGLFALRNVESIQYVNPNSIGRFEQLFNTLVETLNQYEYKKELSPMNQWILLGAVTEVTLQIILAVYHSDYFNERWQQWENFDDEYIKCIRCVLDNTLQQEVDKEKMSSKQKKSIIKAVADKIKEHTAIHSVDRIMLDELIQFAEKTGLLCNDKLIEQLRIIQRNRNCIHSFSERAIDNWDVLRSSVNAIGYIWSDFGYRFESEIQRSYHQKE